MSDSEPDAALLLTRSQRRRLEAERIEDHAPQEGVAIFRKVDKAVLVSVQLPGVSETDIDASLDELELLLDTAGGETLGRVTQRRNAPDVATFIGRGKVEELREVALALDIDAVVFDEDLSPAQQRNLEERLKIKVLDRTIVILDIFAQHASSAEGTAQVELAQLTYLLPRLRGWGAALSRQAGGIGSRGPGESQLEVDRRKLHRRITKLRRDLKTYANVRRTKSAKRRANRVPTVALVGYTNAGKSTMMNAITGADVLIADQLFATLDTTARRLQLPDAREVILTDTVGFVAKLPTALIEAFKSTLEDTIDADLLVHVVDASHPEAAEHIRAVNTVLEDIGAGDVPRIIALNKTDIADPDDVAELRQNLGQQASGVGVVGLSAATKSGVGDVVALITDQVPPRRRVVTAVIPYANADVVNVAYENGHVLSREDREEGTFLTVNITRSQAQPLLAFADVDPWAEADQ